MKRLSVQLKRQSFTVEEKVEKIREVNKTKSQRNVAKLYNVTPTTYYCVCGRQCDGAHYCLLCNVPMHAISCLNCYITSGVFCFYCPPLLCLEYFALLF
jgi:hypothetical protein